MSKRKGLELSFDARASADNKSGVRSFGTTANIGRAQINTKVNLGRGGSDFSGSLEVPVGENTTATFSGGKRVNDSEIMLTLNKRFKYGGEVDLKMGFKLAVILGILLFASVAGSASYNISTIKWLYLKETKLFLRARYKNRMTLLTPIYKNKNK
jgi:hypothetical protein